MNLCSGQQKITAQTNALILANLLMAISGMHIGFGILNFWVDQQQWAWEASTTTIYMVIISWYLGALLGLILAKFLLKDQETKVIGIMATAFYFFGGLLHVLSPTSALTIAGGRALAGVGHGVIYITTIIYAGEIAVKHIRGRILATLHVCTFLGMLIYSSFTINTNLATSSLDPNRTMGMPKGQRNDPKKNKILQMAF